LNHSRAVLLLCAAACIAAGTFPLLDALDVLPGSAARMSAPRWVVMIAASLFIFCGFYVVLLALFGAARARAFGMVLGMAMFLGLSAVVHWVAFGSGPRACGGGVSAVGIGVSGPVPDWECRAAFGYGAIFLDFMLLRGTAWWIGRDHPGKRSIRLLEKASERGMGLMLLPLVLLAWLGTTAKDRVASWRARPRPGASSPPPPGP
jgi:hypothetical protein